MGIPDLLFCSTHKVIDDRLYSAILRSLEQMSRLTALAWGSTWVSSFTAHFLNIIIIIKRISTAPIYHNRWQHRALYNNTNHTHTHTISTEVVYLQRWHGWCHVKLQPSLRKSCVHHTAMLHVTSCKATVRNGVCVFSCHLHFWQNDRDLLRATAVTRGWNGYWNESAQKVDPGEENSPAAPAGIRTRDLSITSLAL